MTGLTQVQKTILNCLNDKREHVIVHGAYIGDVLSLQCQGLVTSELTDDHKLRVRLKPTEPAAGEGEGGR